MQRETAMTPLIPENVSNWLDLVTIIGVPPRDPRFSVHTAIIDFRRIQVCPKAAGHFCGFDFYG